MSSSSVYQSFRRINIISRIFGVMPLKMVPGDQISGPICLISTFDYVYSVVLLIVSIAHGILAPFYVLHTIMPYAYQHSMFSVASDVRQPMNDESVIDEDEISEMATVMKILNPIMISLSSICSRMVALTFLHRRFSEFITVLHSTDRLMDVTIKSHVSTASKTFLQTIDKYLLWYFALVGVPVNIFYIYTVSAANSKAGVVWCVILAFNNMACFSTDMQFIRCACMLHYRFRVINNQLETFASIWNFKRGLVLYLPDGTF